MNLSWFCHEPILGRPCGMCGPCEDAMMLGMQWRVPAAAQHRHKYKKIYSPIFRGLRKLKIIE